MKQCVSSQLLRISLYLQDMSYCLCTAAQLQGAPMGGATPTALWGGINVESAEGVGASPAGRALRLYQVPRYASNTLSFKEFSLFQNRISLLPISPRMGNGNDSIKILMRLPCWLLPDYSKIMLLIMIYSCFSAFSRSSSFAVYWLHKVSP